MSDHEHEPTPETSAQPQGARGRGPLDPEGDPFHPPSIPTLVGCLHCGEEYDSYLIEWRITNDTKGRPHGYWCCPTEHCTGAGFGFDIHPVDYDYIDPDGREMGWSEDPPPDPDTDDTRPPDEAVQVRCECCGKFYPSDKMVWWVNDDDDDEYEYQERGWRCPVRDCDGMGFGYDVRPTDPDYQDPEGRRILRPGEVYAPPPPPSVTRGNEADPFDDSIEADDIPF